MPQQAPSPQPPPPLTALGALQAQLDSAGWAVIDARSLAELCRLSADAPSAWRPMWPALPPDPHLRDGGRYRRRRHGCFTVAEDGAVSQVPHRAHWQPVEYNALHGGIQRWFEPLPLQLVDDPAWTRLLAGLAGVATLLRGAQTWYVEAHPFRIDTTDGIGRPTPEGAHRDGAALWMTMTGDRRFVALGFKRQTPIGPHVADFVSFPLRIVIDVTPDTEDAAAAEMRRQKLAWMSERNYRIIDVGAAEIVKDAHAALERIFAVLSGEPSGGPG